MGTIAAFRTETKPNPIDLVEELVSANDWPHHRQGDDELALEVTGQWCDYRVYFGWSDELSVMQFSAAFDMKVPKARRAAVHELLSIVNERMWIGHFDASDEDGMVLFRHAILLRGAHGPSAEQVEDLIDIALVECERFYPAFQFVLWGGKAPQEAIEASMLETVGEA